MLINEVVLGSHEEESSVELRASEAEFSSASWSNLSTCVVVETSSGTASRSGLVFQPEKSSLRAKTVLFFSRIIRFM